MNLFLSVSLFSCSRKILIPFGFEEFLMQLCSRKFPWYYTLKLSLRTRKSVNERRKVRYKRSLAPWHKLIHDWLINFKIVVLLRNIKAMNANTKTFTSGETRLSRWLFSRFLLLKQLRNSNPIRDITQFRQYKIILLESSQ